MAPIAFQFGADAARYFEYSGYQGMRDLWMNAIMSLIPNGLRSSLGTTSSRYVCSPIDDPNSSLRELPCASGLPTQPARCATSTAISGLALLPYFIECTRPALSRTYKNSVFWPIARSPSTIRQPVVSGTLGQADEIRDGNGLSPTLPYSTLTTIHLGRSTT